jgi:hypothetical protein
MSVLSLKDDLNGMYNDTCVKIYNPEKKELIDVLPTYHKAANYLGVRYSLMQQKAKSKKRIYSPILKMEVAVRLSARGSKEEELLKKHDKHKP